MDTNLRIVALDLALKTAAIAWTCDHHGRQKLGVRSVHTARVNHDRIDHTRIHRVLEDVAAAVQCKPHLVVIEDTFTRGGGSDIPLIGLRSVVCHWLWSKRIPYADVAPSTVKVWATGSGATRGENKVTKDKVVAAVIGTYGGLLSIDTRDDNQADAVALLSMACYAYGRPLVSGLNSQHVRALSSVRWPDLSTEAGPVVPVVGAAVSGGAGGDARRPARTRSRAGAR